MDWLLIILFNFLAPSWWYVSEVAKLFLQTQRAISIAKTSSYFSYREKKIVTGVK